MKDLRKTKLGLIEENALLKRRIRELEQSKAERNKVEMALRDSETRLMEAQRIAKIGSWEHDLLTNKLIWSDEMFRLHEIERERFGASYEAFLEVVHPEDRDAVRAVYTQSMENHKPYQFAHRLLMRDGRIKHVIGRYDIYYSPEGKPICSLGTIQDITEQKEAEEEREKLILELQRALSQVKTLSGLLPICASCKKIRNDKGYWEQIEVYVRDRSEAEFSHGICPECAEKLYPEFYKKK